MKKLYSAVVIICIISVTLNLVAFTRPDSIDEHILVEIYEVPDYDDKGIHIHYGENKTEIVRFHEFQKENHSKTES